MRNIFARDVCIQTCQLINLNKRWCSNIYRQISLHILYVLAEECWCKCADFDPGVKMLICISACFFLQSLTEWIRMSIKLFIMNFRTTFQTHFEICMRTNTSVMWLWSVKISSKSQLTNSFCHHAADFLPKFSWTCLNQLV